MQSGPIDLKMFGVVSNGPRTRAKPSLNASLHKEGLGFEPAHQRCTPRSVHRFELLLECPESFLSVKEKKWPRAADVDLLVPGHVDKEGRECPSKVGILVKNEFNTPDKPDHRLPARPGAITMIPELWELFPNETHQVYHISKHRWTTQIQFRTLHTPICALWEPSLPECRTLGQRCVHSNQAGHRQGQELPLRS